MTSKLHPHVIADTGIKVNIKKVSPYTLSEFQRSYLKRFPEPEAPLQDVDYGDGKVVKEPNLAHPDYKNAMQTHRAKMNEALQNMMIERGIVYELTEADKEEVEAFKTYWKEISDTPLEDSDKFIFIRHIAIGTVEDLGELANVISRRSGPTEGAIGEQLKSL